MAINLQKGQKIDIGLSQVIVGLGWDPNESGSGTEYDLDVSAFMLNAKKKLPDDGFFVFYNNLSSPDGSVISAGDDTSGRNSGDGDDETIAVNLGKVSPQIEEILFAATIHEAQARKQNFGQVRNSYIRVCDAKNGEEICKYELGEDFSIETGIEFGRLYKRNGAWRFEAIGTGTSGGLEAFLNKYN